MRVLFVNVYFNASTHRVTHIQYMLLILLCFSIVLIAQHIVLIVPPQSDTLSHSAIFHPRELLPVIRNVTDQFCQHVTNVKERLMSIEKIFCPLMLFGCHKFQEGTWINFTDNKWQEECFGS